MVFRKTVPLFESALRGKTFKAEDEGSRVVFDPDGYTGKYIRAEGTYGGDDKEVAMVWSIAADGALVIEPESAYFDTVYRLHGGTDTAFEIAGFEMRKSPSELEGVYSTWMLEVD